MKQKEAGLRKNCTPLLSDMAMHMEPITIMVRLKRAKTAAARFRPVREITKYKAQMFRSACRKKSAAQKMEELL